MNAVYVVIKDENEMTARDENFACDVFEEGGLENLIIALLDALALKETKVNWSANQIRQIKEVIEQVMKEQCV